MNNYAHAHILYHSMAQYLLRKRLSKFNKVGKAAVEKELNQIHTRSTFAPTNIANMSDKAK